MGQFELAIRLGNAGMESPWDVADVLRRIADYLDEMGEDHGAWREDGRAEGATRTVRDVNGNRVGGWKVVE